MPEHRELPGNPPLQLLLDLPAPDLPAPDLPAPVVVLCHGFKGFCEWGFFPALAALLAARGLAVVRFNFRGGGIRLGEDRVSDLEAFRRHTMSAERDDLRQVLASLGGLAPGRLDLERLALFGHSRGGGVALLAAADDTLRERLRALVTWSAVSTFDRLGATEKARWRATGEHVVVNARTGQELPIGLELLADVEGHRDGFDLLAAAQRRQAPWLLVHGEADETVPVGEADALHAAASGARGELASAGPCELLRVAGADHAFGSKHPFAGPHPHLIAALNATQAWLLRWLRAS